MRSMSRPILALSTVCALAACTTELDPSIRDAPLGDFSLDRVVVIADQPQRAAFSREMSDEALRGAVQDAVAGRLGRLEGEGSFSIGIKVVGYALAQPGIPVLVAPRSALFMNVNVYDAVPRRLNAEVKRLTVFEDAGGDTVLGSGFTQSAEEQLAELADNAAIEIEKWLRETPEMFVLPVRLDSDTLPGEA